MVDGTPARRVTRSMATKGLDGTETTPSKRKRKTNTVSDSGQKNRNRKWFLLAVGWLAILQLFPGDGSGMARALLIVAWTISILNTMFTPSVLLYPHPTFWRFHYGLTVFYLLLLLVVLALSEEYGRLFLVHGLSLSPDGESEGPVDIFLDCDLTYPNFYRQLTSIWFCSHAIGWWAKMLIWRDWRFAVANSLGFELYELTMSWLIPEFHECYWDSLLMDFALANFMGMLAGGLTLKIFKVREFNWAGKHSGYTKVSSVLFSWVDDLFRFLGLGLSGLGTYFDFSVTNKEGKTWRDLDWRFFTSWWRCFNFSFMLIVGNLLEGNSFFLINAISIPANHWVLKARLLLLCTLSIGATTEHYNYVGNVERDDEKRVTHNVLDTRVTHNHYWGHCTWLLVIVLAMEICVVGRFNSFPAFVPPLDVVVPYLIFTVMFLTFAAFKIPEARRARASKQPSPNFTLLNLLGYASFLPLLYLTKNWHWGGALAASH